MQSYWYWGNAQLYGLCHHTAETAGSAGRKRLFPTAKYRSDSAETWATVSASFAGGADSDDEDFVASSGDDGGGEDCGGGSHDALHQQWAAEADRRLEEAATAAATGRPSRTSGAAASAVAGRDQRDL